MRQRWRVHVLRRSLTRAPATATIASRGQSRPSDSTGLDVSTSRGSLRRPHACRVGDGVRRIGTHAAGTDRPRARRLHLVPRYRQRLAYVPLGQGRPVWADDPHFNPYYHIRHTALPRPADDAALKRLAGTTVLPATGPLQAAVGDLAGAEHVRRALRASRQDPPRARRRHLRRGHHHRAVRHRSRASPERASTPWSAKPLPGPAKLLGEALIERSTVPAEMVRGARAAFARAQKSGCAAQGRSGQRRRDDARRDQPPAPPSPFNVDIGPHRRYTFLDTDLAQFKAIKDSLGGTLNDVVLTPSACRSGATCAITVTTRTASC